MVFEFDLILEELNLASYFYRSSKIEICLILENEL